MTTWTEAQIDRHLHLWEHRHGPDSPEAGIVRQLRAERDAARADLLTIANDLTNGWVEPKTIARQALPNTQETPHE